MQPPARRGAQRPCASFVRRPDEHRDDACTALARGAERRVIGEAQVVVEPDERNGRAHAATIQESGHAPRSPTYSDRADDMLSSGSQEVARMQAMVAKDWGEPRDMQLT